MNAPVDCSYLILETPRLRLRPWRMEDLADFNRYASVDGVGQMAGWAPHRRPRRQPMILFADTFLNPTGAASPTPSSTLLEPLRRHHRQPYRSSFAYTILNPTGAALPTHKSTASDPLPRTLIQPTGAASDAPSTAADPHRRHHP